MAGAVAVVLLLCLSLPVALLIGNIPPVPAVISEDPAYTEDETGDAFVKVDRFISHQLRPLSVKFCPRPTVHDEATAIDGDFSSPSLALTCSCHTSKYYSHTPSGVACTFNYINNDASGSSLSILRRDTPIEGMLSEFLGVAVATGDGSWAKVPYDGIHLRRMLPSNEDYTEIAPGLALSVTVDISTVYNLSKPGTYKIGYTKPLMYKMADNDEKKQLVFQTDCVSMLHVKGTGHRRTVGEMARMLNSNEQLTQSVLAPRYHENYPSGLRRETTQVFKAVFAYLRPALRSVNEDSPHYRRWFGAIETNRKSRVKQVLSSIQSEMQVSTFTLLYNGHHCMRKVLGYTWKSARIIVLCPLQYRLPHILHPYSQVSTLLHELTHAVARTSDVTYGVGHCLNLAREHPDRAVENAASYGLFFITINPAEYGIDSSASHGSVMFMTLGPVYLRFTDQRLDCNYPKLIMDGWGNIPSEFSDGFDSMLIIKSGQMMITRNSRILYYLSIDDPNPRVASLNSASHWKHLPSSFRSGFDSSVQLPNGKTYFTHGSQYICYSSFPQHITPRNTKFVPDSGYPKSLNNHWGNIAYDSFPRGFDAMLLISKDVCLFKGEEYICFDSTKHQIPNNSNIGSPHSLRHKAGRLHNC